MNIKRSLTNSLGILVTLILLASPSLGQRGFDRSREGESRDGERRSWSRSERGGSERGGRGSSRRRGGFDASAMLKRLDANQNGVLDPDEQQGSARFILNRVQQVDSSIVPGQPIPIEKIVKAFEKMRAQRDGGSRESERGSGRGRSERDSSEEAWTSELLVPGFGVETEPVPIQGFGAAAELMSVQITDQDRQEAEETMRRYDRDRNGMLSPEELARGRFGGNPLDFDRNGDGQLSVNELAIRYARRREVKEAQEAERRRDEARNRDRQPGEVKEVDLYQGRRSYRTLAARTLPEGTPGFFIDKDLNGDGQIEMAEFASEWSDDVVNEFFQWDLNRDGVITLEEARQAVEMGRQLSPAMQTSAAEQTSAAAPASTSSENTSSARAADQPVEPAADAAAAGDLPDEKLIRYAERIISRYDKNGDKALTASEWSGMLMSPAAADKNRDGRVTVLEYASWLQSRSKQ